MPMYGTQGQFGGGMQNPQFGQWASQAANPWEQPWWQQADPRAAIQGAQNDIVRGANDMFNRAGSYLGASGTQGGTPWANKMGGIATDASRQMAESANRYTYEAANSEANRRAGAWDSSQNRQLSWNQQQSGQQNQQLSDYWQRQYDAMLRGGSNEYMNKWQQQQTPWANAFANQQPSPWAR